MVRHLVAPSTHCRVGRLPAPRGAAGHTTLRVLRAVERHDSAPSPMGPRARLRCACPARTRPRHHPSEEPRCLSSPASPMVSQRSDRLLTWPRAGRGLRRDGLVCRRPRRSAGTRREPAGGRGVPARRDHDHCPGHVGPWSPDTCARVGGGPRRLCRRPGQLLARASHGPATLQLDDLSQAREGPLGPGTRPHRPARGTGSARQSPHPRGARDRPSRCGRRWPVAGSLHGGLCRRVGRVGDRLGGGGRPRGNPVGLVVVARHRRSGRAAARASMVSQDTGCPTCRYRSHLGCGLTRGRQGARGAVRPDACRLGVLGVSTPERGARGTAWPERPGRW